jgi:glycosyltransferase involved in cell wall biosynthesis
MTLLEHKRRQGPGGAIITGYARASADGCDIAVVVGGDNQMLMDEMNRLLDPIVEEKADYAKGNRFVLSNVADTLEKMPGIRLAGNWIITGLCKIASGYYKIMDVVDGYTAISKKAIDTVNWARAWRGYGYPMDFLIRLNAYGFKVADVPRTAVYLKGERQSQIKGLDYALKVAPMLIRGFFWRLKFKYLYRDFHPLVLFYFSGISFLFIGVLLGLFLAGSSMLGFTEGITASKFILSALFILSGLQLTLFAMLFDMENA